MSGISFKISAPGRPSSTAPPSRPSSALSRSHTAQADSDDDHDAAESARRNGRDRKRPRLDADGEEVVEFGGGGARGKSTPTPSAPLVIPSLPNKDWRKAAEEMRGSYRKKKEIYLPEKAGGMSMASGSESAARGEVEGVEKIGTEEVKGGLSFGEKNYSPAVEIEAKQGSAPPPPSSARPPTPSIPAGLTEEQRALRELLGTEGGADGPADELDAIVSAPDARNGPMDESEAFKRDVDSRPDEASLQDYARIPVGQFGLAMLRGMGWQPGQAASRSGRGATEAYVPKKREALLGIGATSMRTALGGDAAGKGKDGKGPNPRNQRLAPALPLRLDLLLSPPFPLSSPFFLLLFPPRPRPRRPKTTGQGRRSATKR
ncbi:DNA primase large subunit Spp2 [Rhodotorula toruloides]